MFISPTPLINPFSFYNMLVFMRDKSELVLVLLCNLTVSLAKYHHSWLWSSVSYNRTGGFQPQSLCHKRKKLWRIEPQQAIHTVCSIYSYKCARTLLIPIKKLLIAKCINQVVIKNLRVSKKVLKMSIHPIAGRPESFQKQSLVPTRLMSSWLVWVKPSQKWIAGVSKFYKCV